MRPAYLSIVVRKLQNLAGAPEASKKWAASQSNIVAGKSQSWLDLSEAIKHQNIWISKHQQNNLLIRPNSIYYLLW